MGLLGLALMAAPELAHAAPGDLFYQRTVLIAAGERCAFFTPDTAAALAAGALQARGDALRAGADAQTLQAAEQDARLHGGRADCAAPKTLAAAAQVRNAFAGFTKLTRIAYPGQVAGWQADRTATTTSRWRLAQESRFGADRLTFGLAGQDTPGALMAVAQFADGATPYAARLVLRDQDRTLGPYLDQRGAASLASLPLPRRLPPAGGQAVFSAQTRAPAGVDLLPTGSGWAFRFPQAAAAAMAQLDPREAVAVEFLFRDDTVRRAYVEVGDFAAGRAFLQLANR